MLIGHTLYISSGQGKKRRLTEVDMMEMGVKWLKYLYKNEWKELRDPPVLVGGCGNTSNDCRSMVNQEKCLRG